MDISESSFNITIQKTVVGFGYFCLHFTNLIFDISYFVEFSIIESLSYDDEIEIASG